MVEAEDFDHLFRLIQDPALILDERGLIERANPAARGFLEDDPTGGNLLDLVQGDKEDVVAYLQRCSARMQPLPGAFTLSTAGGAAKRWQGHGSRFSSGSTAGGARIFLTCRRQGVEEFSILGLKLRELRDEVRHRRRVQAKLEEVLAEKDTLLRELQHRLKNHTQMLLAMVRNARRDAKTLEARAVTEALLARIDAIGAAQSYMYGMSRWQLVSARQFIPALCDAVAASWPPGATLRVDVDDVGLDNDHAVPLSLIINELVTNALKHGLTFGPGRVELALRRGRAELVLTVRDSGAKWHGSTHCKEGAGLQLVKGLCRQIGAAFEITLEAGGTDTEPATCCLVRWSDDRSGASG